MTDGSSSLVTAQRNFTLGFVAQTKRSSDQSFHATAACDVESLFASFHQALALGIRVSSSHKLRLNVHKRAAFVQPENCIERGETFPIAIIDFPPLFPEFIGLRSCLMRSLRLIM
jgi:hypothetical protein